MKGLEARIAGGEEVMACRGSRSAGGRWRWSFAVACSGPLELANIQVGRSLNQDGSVASITTLFKPSETVYVAVQTRRGQGRDRREVEVRQQGGRRADQAGRLRTGPTSTEFHLQNSGGFPPGDYSVDVLIDGVQVGTRELQGRRVTSLTDLQSRAVKPD